jgi:pimeloyl-ACP methyl ester carboxylesterase
MMMKRAFLGLAAALAAVSSGDAAPVSEKPVSIILVHGAFVDASGWQPVFNLLAKDGYEVLVVQNPTITLQGDVTATQQAIAVARHPVILVSHSYGGAVITQAGGDPKVKGLVYLAAFAPDVGESVFELATAPTTGAEPPPLLPPKNGFIQVDQEKFPSAFAADVDPTVTRFMAASQVPWGLGAVQAKITTAAWKTKPVYYLLATQDRMIPPQAQRSMALRAKATLVEAKSSHAVMLSQPRYVADFITLAATEAK